MINATESVLKSAGFQVSERCSARPSCFCLVTRKDADLVFFNLPNDLGNISQRDALELKTLSAWFSAAPLFIGDATREKPLEDDTVYSRYGIHAVTPKTLKDVISHRMHPLVEAGPGGYFVQLDTEALRSQRQKLGLSVGKLAELLGVSRRTLYGYERGMTKASVTVAYNIEWVLGIPVVKPIDVFQPLSSNSGFFAAARRVVVRNRFLQLVMKRLNKCQFHVTPTLRSPFDFIAHSQQGTISILGGIACRDEKNLRQRAGEILSISKIVKAQPVFVTDGEFALDNVPMIRSQDLDEIKKPEDLVKSCNS